MNFKQNFSAKFLVMFFIALIFNSATAEQLAPPNAKMMDKFGVNVASAQATTTLNTVSIGGAMGLTHNLSSHSNNFVLDPEASTADVGMTDSFSTTAHYEEMLPSGSSNSYSYKGVSYSVFNVLRVADSSGSAAFVVSVNGVPAPNYYLMCNPNCPMNYTYEPLGDVRNTLVVSGDYLNWTKPDGTVVQFYRGQPANAFQTGFLYSITYPNGFKITVNRRVATDSAVTSVNTNTGFQLNYVYTDDNRQLDPSKAGINIYNTQVADSKAWSYYNPKYIYGINNAVEYCNPQPGLPESSKGGIRSTATACSQKWPNAMITWPGGMPRAIYLGDSTVSITQTVNSDTPTTTTEYRTRSMDKAITVLGGNPESGKWFIPRLIGVKNSNSTAVNTNYSYQNVGGTACEDQFCGLAWYAKEAGRLYNATGQNGSAIYSVNQPTSNTPNPLRRNGGADLAVFNVAIAGGGPSEVDLIDGSIFNLEVNARGNLTSSTPKDSAKRDYFYDDNVRGNLTKITINNNSAETLEATYPSNADCINGTNYTNSLNCNQARSIKDARGNVTNYTYNLDSGGAESVTLPPNKRGIRAQTRYQYTAKTAYYKKDNTQNLYVADKSIWLKTAEFYCINSNYSTSSPNIGDGHGNFNGSCGTGDQEVVTRYEYNSNNLLLTGMTVTADGITKRTCYQYDIYGNRLGQTLPNANLASCTAAATQEASAYTSATRYNFAKQVTGTIAPDPDGTWALHYHATRNTYNDATGLLTKVENGELASWQNESVKPSDWSGFTVTSSKTFSYDSYGRKISETTFDKTSTVKGLTEFSYDTNNHVKCTAVRMTLSATGDACTSGNLGGTDPDRITQYSYDLLDQVLTEQRAVGTTIAQTYVTNTYDGHRLTSQTDANNNRTELRYDSSYKRLQRMVYPSPSTKNTVNESDYVELTNYDANNNAHTERKRSGALINYQFDNLDRKIEKHLADSTKDVYYDYDSRGLQLSALFGTSATSPGIATGYDGFGNVNLRWNSMLSTGRKLKFEYDLDNDRTRIYHSDNQYFTYHFDGLDRMDVLYEGGGTRMLQIDYDPDGHRKLITRRNSVSTTAYNYTDGIHLDSFTQDFTGSANDLTNSFQYNKANQISQLTLGNNLYYYNGNDNRTGAYATNGLNEYTNIAGQPLGYDASANLTNDGNFVYTYDDENRLLTAVNGSYNASFIYDPMGRLFQSTINGVKT